MKKLVKIANNLLKLAQDQLSVYTFEQFDELTEKQKAQWKGYHYKIAYEIVTEESAAEGDAEERGWAEEGSEAYGSLDDLLEESDIRFNSWLEWSSSHPQPGDWLTTEPQQEDYSTGEYKSYSLWIYRGDGKPLSKEEMSYISKALGVRM